MRLMRTATALEEFVMFERQSLNEKAALRREFLELAGENVADVIHGLESEGEDVLPICIRWYGTPASPVDGEPIEVQPNPYEDAVLAVNSWYWHERRAADAAARLPLDYERRREPDRVHHEQMLARLAAETEGDSERERRREVLEVAERQERSFGSVQPDSFERSE